MTFFWYRPTSCRKARKLLGDDKNVDLMPKKDPESAENMASSIYGLKWMCVGAGSGPNALGFKGKQWALVDSERLQGNRAHCIRQASGAERGQAR